jgi:hypothetical protein
MYADVNRAISSSLRSLAQQMHQRRMDPPQLQTAVQSAASATPSSEAKPCLQRQASSELEEKDSHAGNEHLAGEAASIIAEEIDREEKEALREGAVPFESSRWLAGRETVSNKPSRDEMLSTLGPLDVPDGDHMTAEDYRAALQPQLGFQLSIDKSGIDHEHAGDGVWLRGVAEMGQVVALHPGVVYSQAFHMCVQPHSPRLSQLLLASVCVAVCWQACV